MTTYTTPPPRAEQTGPEASEPARRASRFDERGIALQTVIIMVVLLAIAGGVAAVLLNRGSEASSQLEAQNVTVSAYQYGSAALCRAAGHSWDPGKPTATANTGDVALAAAEGVPLDSTKEGFCKP